MTLSGRVNAIRDRVAEAARACARDPESIRLVAVCKRQPVQRIIEACRLGLTDLGESTAQGLLSTSARLEEEGISVRWHFVGALQRNKVNQVLGARALIHSVDRLSLAEALNRRAKGPGAVDVLVQVNIGREPQKGGALPEEALALAEQVAGMEGLRLRGLMGMPPAGVDPKPYFEELATLSQALQAMPAGLGAGEISMGMSDDFEVAIACGATMVRVGTALFGERLART